MIYLDDAGVGCFIGIPVIVGCRLETGQKEVRHFKHIDQVASRCKSILESLNVEKNELIKVCHGNYFKEFRSYLKRNGYMYESCVIDDVAQDIVEDAFMEKLYSLGVSRDIILHEKEYDLLNEELVVAVIANPELQKYIRFGKQRKTRVKTRIIMQKIENATFRYPNLIKNLVS